MAETKSARLTRQSAVAVAPTVLGGYTGDNAWRRNRRRIFIAFGAFAFFYGFVFAIFGRFFPLQMIVPHLFLAGTIVWLLPETGRAPVQFMERLLVAFVVALLCWPDYLAFEAPGLPWITLIRLIALPMALAWLVGISISTTFREDLKQIIDATPAVWKLLVAFTVIGAVTIVFSNSISLSINRYVISLINWGLIFFVSAYAFTREGAINRFAYLLWGIALFVCALGLWEWQMQAVPWAKHIPSFLAIDDPAVQKMLQPRSRIATGIYRIQSKFTTPLGLAEYFALTVPFLIHLFMNSNKLIERLALLATFPLVFYVVLLTDSRLGIVGFLLAFLLYLLVWAALRWRSHKNSIFAPALVMAYPAVFCAFIVATFTVGRLRNMVWGTGAAQASTDSRKEQIADGIPMIFSHPWGHGMGMGAQTLGFFSPSGVLTIDSHYLVVGLEYGILGFIAYYGIFIAAVVYGARALIQTKQREALYLAPLCITFINFLVIKSVFAQQENHPLVFVMLGALCALVWRVRNEGLPSEMVHKLRYR